MNAAELTIALKDEAGRLGFALAGACPAVTPAGIGQFGQWLDRGYGGQMDYLHQRRKAYDHPRHVLDGARSILMLAMEYRTAAPQLPTAGQGQISRYAWSPVDYHDVIHEPVFCRPCMLRDCPIDHRCMKRITVDRVFDAVRRRLG